MARGGGGKYLEFSSGHVTFELFVKHGKYNVGIECI